MKPQKIKDKEKILKAVKRKESPKREWQTDSQLSSVSGRQTSHTLKGWAKITVELEL